MGGTSPEVLGAIPGSLLRDHTWQSSGNQMEVGCLHDKCPNPFIISLVFRDWWTIAKSYKIPVVDWVRRPAGRWIISLGVPYPGALPILCWIPFDIQLDPSCLPTVLHCHCLSWTGVARGSVTDLCELVAMRLWALQDWACAFRGSMSRL